MDATYTYVMHIHLRGKTTQSTLHCSLQKAAHAARFNSIPSLSELVGCVIGPKLLHYYGHPYELAPTAAMDTEMSSEVVPGCVL